MSKLGKLLYDEPKNLIPIAFIKFRGATMTIDDDGRVDYTPRDDVVINAAQICAFYDHTIIVMGHKIRVMETFEDIKARLRVR